MARSGATPSLLTRVADSSLFRYLVLSAQLAAVLWAIQWYRLEGRAFQKLAVLVWAGFTVNYFLPSRARLPFFGLLSFAGVLAIFGPSQGAWLLALGLAVIALCHLPVPFWARLTIVAVAAVLLCLMRAGQVGVPWPGAIWPIFGSMFALRLMIYLYDLKHRRAPFSFWRSASYFFMLPNIVFPLFPVVDYQTLRRSHEEDKERARVFQKGIDWMVRGAVHLVLYRLIYQNLPIDSTSVADVGDLLRYFIWPFLLYLQVSGLFHLVIGMLRLFGFNLPETHHLFYLASSFTDFWRRINIYWKDFMMKVFYYPTFFGIRRIGGNVALVVGTFVVFLATWVLHAWQWFWLRGSVVLKASDVLFWSILAVLVAVNVVLESSRPMTRRLGSGPGPWGESLRKAFRTLGVFLAICLLWSLWVSDSVPEWLSLFSVLGKANSKDLWLVPVVLGLAAVFILVALYYERRRDKPFAFYPHVLQSGATLAALILVGAYKVQSSLHADVAAVLGKLRSPGLNTRDAALRQRGYYEKLNDVGWDNLELAKVYVVKPPDWGPIRYRPDLARTNEGLPYLYLVPNARGQHRGVEVQFNRWGIRDREYPDQPEPGSYRIALVGASHTFASGIVKEGGFEALVEDRLNREDRLAPFERIEILNFAVEGYSPLDVLVSTEQKVFAVKPHALLYVVHASEARGATGSMARLLGQGTPFPYPALQEFADAAGVRPGTKEAVAWRALQPQREAILAWAYRQLVGRCRSHGVVPILAHLPVLSPNEGDLPVPTLLAIAREAGFLTLDLSGVYAGHDPEKLRLAVWDDHPNATGHRLVAQELYDALRGAEASLWRKDAEQRDQRADTQLHSQRVPSGGGS
jgi:hypothetical protein